MVHSAINSINVKSFGIEHWQHEIRIDRKIAFLLCVCVCVWIDNEGIVLTQRCIINRVTGKATIDCKQTSVAITKKPPLIIIDTEFSLYLSLAGKLEIVGSEK